MKPAKYIIFVILIAIPTLGFSQKWKLSRSEYSYGIGVVNCFSDIGGSSSKDGSSFSSIDFAYTRPVLSVGYRYRLYERIAVRANFAYANIHGSDANSYLENRNYAYTTNMFELNGQLQYDITKEKQVSTYGIMSLRDKVKNFNSGVNFYVFAGIGGAYFKPKAKDDFAVSPGIDRFTGNKNLALVFPVGIGLKYPLSPSTSISLDIGGRFTTSDFIDGLSTPTSEANDLYYFTVIHVITKIMRSKQRR